LLCEWLEEIRFHGSLKAMSVNGKVGCLPGRTIAFRKSIIADNMDEFMNEKFLGFHKEVSDDRSLTNVTLKQGYKTVLQSTAVVSTAAPESWKKYLRQQLRWSEGSQYNNIKMSGSNAQECSANVFHTG
jgi:hyaluronan synthase